MMSREEYDKVLDDYINCKNHGTLKEFFENLGPNSGEVYKALMESYPEDFGIYVPWKKVYDAFDNRIINTLSSVNNNPFPERYRCKCGETKGRQHLDSICFKCGEKVTYHEPEI